MNYLNNKLIMPLLIVMGIFVVGCEDMIEENLEKKAVTIVSPPNNYESTDLTISFQWNEVEGADEYNLQVWNSSGIRLLNTYVDTIIYDYTFPYFDTFTWKVRAENTATESPYTTYTIVVDSTDDLSTTTLMLSSPDDNYYTSDFDVVFKWDALYSAEDYRVELLDLSETLIDNSMITTADSIEYTFSTEGDYIWRVRAQNASSNTQYASRYITIDATLPNTPSLIYPVAGDTASAVPFTMSWNRWGESGSPITDSIFVASDSLFTTIVVSEEVSDSTYSFTDLLSTGAHYWFVRSMDAAGNESSNSDTAKFVID